MHASILRKMTCCDVEKFCDLEILLTGLQYELPGQPENYPR